MLMHSRFSRVLCTSALFVCLAAPLHAQTIDDGIMLGKRELLTGNFYSWDTWDQYWEGTLKRTNGNIGTITTEVNTIAANYGVFDRFNLIGTVPYVWTRASQGVLHGIEGFQDLTLAAKWSVLEKPMTSYGTLRTIFVVAVGIPMTDYNPELLPLSIGLGSTRVSWRGTVNYQSTPGWYLNGSTAYTIRSKVVLDRPYFYTNDEFVMSDRVDMPDTFDYVASAGYMKPGGLMTAVSFSQQQTLGGGDIRRQDMPFVSNRMNSFRAGAMVMYPIPKLAPLAVHFALAHTFNGRNVGEATTVTTGLQYTFNGSSTR
jgi:Putative MetA-pathway of phenol degradation